MNRIQAQLLRLWMGITAALWCSYGTAMSPQKASSDTGVFQTLRAPTFSMTNYWWLNEREIVYSRDSQQGSSFARLNVVTGVVTELSGLTSLVIATGRRCDEVAPSPNGRFVAWISKAGDRVLSIASVSEQKMSSETDLGREARNPIWSADSTKIVCFGYLPIAYDNVARPVNTFFDEMFFTEAFVVQMGRQVRVSKFPIASISGFTTYFRMENVNRHGVFRPVYQRTSCTDITRLVVSNQSIQTIAPSATVTFSRLDLTKTVPAEPYTVVLPGRSGLDDLQFSPNGNAIAWILHHDDVSELWLSTDNGKDMRLMHTFPHQSEFRPQPPYEPMILKWIPSGDSLSVTLNDTMFLIRL